MNAFCRCLGAALLVGVFLTLPFVSAQNVKPFDRNARPGDPPPVPSPEQDNGRGSLPQPTEEGPEVQGRGPVHEGFAQPYETPQAGPFVRTAPPNPIPESPPEERPEGARVVWVPGYWAFDDDAENYVWVSGFWRVAPEGRKWVPGYWSRVDGGHRWVNGFWAAENQAEVPYVPEAPPESLERGPSVPAPDDDYAYSPGCWVYAQSRYAWRPGQWYRPRIGLVWCPPRWNWSPRGYVCVSGYWDRCLDTRGVLFAPVCFSRPLWQTRGWCYRPRYVVPPRILVSSLWIRPRTGCYAYGDYYGARYSKMGYQPWAVYGAKVRDPLFGYYRWANRDNARWQRSLVAQYEGRSRGELTLPPRTLAGLEKLSARDRALSADLEVVRPTTNWKSEHLRMVRVTREDQAQRERYIESLSRAAASRQSAEMREMRRDDRPTLALEKIPTIQREARRDLTPRVETPPKEILRSQPKMRPETMPKLVIPRNDQPLLEKPLKGDPRRQLRDLAPQNAPAPKGEPRPIDKPRTPGSDGQKNKGPTGPKK